MKIRADNILLCILWLLAVTLGTSFWFNIAFGFDIFSASHWNYIASLQASRAPVKPGFYVSMAISIFLALFGLYVIVRPRFRKIKMPIMRIKNTNEQKIEKAEQNTDLKNSDASTLDVLPAEQQQMPKEENRPYAPSSASRPPRLVLPTLNNNFVSQPPAQPASAPINQQPNVQEQDWSEVRNIFTSAGYTVKPNARVNGVQTALIAIGTNETMWLGCVGVKTTVVREIIEKFQQVFSDTLDETEIEINGFVIAAPDAATSEFQDILMFNSIGELREYMSDKQNPPLPADDDGMFDAYSQYIDAVITHIGKI